MHCPVCAAVAAAFMCVEARDYWHCPRCAAVFLEPAQRPSPHEEAAHYRLHRNHPDDPAYRRFLDRLARPLLERLPPGSTGLDYGCGPGPALAAMLREAGHAVMLFDPQFHPQRDALDASYDFVTCSETAEHFHDPAAEFRRFDALLKPGGWLALMTGFLPDAAAFASWHYRRDPTHVVFYCEATFRHLAGQFGWHAAFPDANVVLMKKPGMKCNAGETQEAQ